MLRNSDSVLLILAPQSLGAFDSRYFEGRMRRLLPNQSDSADSVASRWEQCSPRGPRKAGGHANFSQLRIVLS